MGFGSLQIDTGALLVMGEHVEVQMRLVEGCLGGQGSPDGVQKQHFFIIWFIKKGTISVRQLSLLGVCSL